MAEWFRIEEQTLSDQSRVYNIIFDLTHKHMDGCATMHRVTMFCEGRGSAVIMDSALKSHISGMTVDLIGREFVHDDKCVQHLIQELLPALQTPMQEPALQNAIKSYAEHMLRKLG